MSVYGADLKTTVFRFAKTTSGRAEGFILWTIVEAGIVTAALLIFGATGRANTCWRYQARNAAFGGLVRV